MSGIEYYDRPGLAAYAALAESRGLPLAVVLKAAEDDALRCVVDLAPTVGRGSPAHARELARYIERRLVEAG